MMSFKEFLLNEAKPNNAPITDEINSVGIAKIEKTEERLYNKTYILMKGILKDGREFTVTPEIITTRKSSKRDMVTFTTYELVVEVSIENPNSTSPMNKFRNETVEFGKVNDKKDTWNEQLEKKMKKMYDWISKNFDGIRVNNTDITRSRG